MARLAENAGPNINHENVDRVATVKEDGKEVQL